MKEAVEGIAASCERNERRKQNKVRIEHVRNADRYKLPLFIRIVGRVVECPV